MHTAAAIASPFHAPVRPVLRLLLPPAPVTYVDAAYISGQELAKAKANIGKK